MKNSGEGLLEFQHDIKLENGAIAEPSLSVALRRLNNKPLTSISRLPKVISNRFFTFIHQIQNIGVTDTMEDFERRKLGVFNLLNVFQLIFGIVIPITAIITKPNITTLGWIAACMPALVSVLVLYLNGKRYHEVSALAYFVLYPVITSIVYLSGMNLGIELFFILYGILAVFFIQDIGHMVFTITLSMISYFILTVVWRNFQFQLEVNGVLYLLNHFVAIIFIFFGLYLIKKENTDYQHSILDHNTILREKNTEIEKQRLDIAAKAELVNKQAAELGELNSLKNKLFSVIAHDLKGPIYALRNVFANVEQYDVPANEIKRMVPEIMKDLNYTTALMENLLQWAKWQMQSLSVVLQEVELSDVANDVVNHVGKQAARKNICIVNAIPENTITIAHRDMIMLVLRNLVSNALKFTPSGGYVTIGAEEHDDFIEVYVLDTGIGIPAEDLEKINHSNYFSTEGTASERGTGLGLILCKDFLEKNGTALVISSEPGNGSRFAFRLKSERAKGKEVNSE